MKRKPILLPKSYHELGDYLMRYKIATTDQIHRDLFEKNEKNTTQKLLRRVERFRLIRKVPTVYKTNVYSLTPEGFRTLIGLDSANRQELSSSKIAHDLRLLDIGQKICKIPKVVAFRSENILATGYNHPDQKMTEVLQENKPDAIVILPHPEGNYTVAIEYEVTAKVYERYKSIFQKYYLAPKVAGVLYICHTEALMKKLIAIDQEIKPCNHSKIYFTTEECFFSEPHPRFQASDKSTFVLGG